jgi:hypothetical protein
MDNNENIVPITDSRAPDRDFDQNIETVCKTLSQMFKQTFSYDRYGSRMPLTTMDRNN